MLSYAVVDVEGNGQQPPDLVEAAVVLVVDGRVGEPVSWLVRPRRRILPIAERVHGISDQDVAACPTVDEVADEMRTALDGRVLVAHNAHVDIGVLTRELPGFAPVRTVDTLRLARHVVPGLDSYRLGSLVDAYGLADGLPADLVPHRAGYDAVVCARLLTHVVAGDGRALTVGDLVHRAPPSDQPALF